MLTPLQGLSGWFISIHRALPYASADARSGRKHPPKPFATNDKNKINNPGSLSDYDLS